MREADRERQKREWEMKERQAEEQRTREEELRRRQQEEMAIRIRRQEEELHRRQQENNLFMQVGSVIFRKILHCCTNVLSISLELNFIFPLPIKRSRFCVQGTSDSQWRWKKLRFRR